MAKKVKKMFGGGMGSTNFDKLTKSSSGGTGAQPSFGNAMKAIMLRGGKLGGGPKTLPGQTGPTRMGGMAMKKGGEVKKMAEGGSTESKYVKELSERREQNPKEFDKQKEMYDAAKQKEAEDKDYSAVDTIKRVGKKVLGMKSGGSVSSTSSRADGCAIKGKTKGKMV